MTYFDRFIGVGGDTTPTIEQRRYDLLKQINTFIPGNLENVSMPDDEPVIKLSWVRVPDPRQRVGEEKLIEVQPLLPIDWVDDGSGFSAIPGVNNFMIIGKLPSGEEELIGYMHLPTESSDFEPELIVDIDEDDSRNKVSWHGADAELWLTLAESALKAQS
jgi:hypothetical protein